MTREIIKFLIVGGVSTALNYSSFFILLKLFELNYLLSSGLGYIFGLVLGYSLNKNWTFEYKNESIKTKLRYVVVYGVNLLLSLLILKGLKTNIGLNPIIGNFIVICYTTIANFMGIKIFVFNEGKI